MVSLGQVIVANLGKVRRVMSEESDRRQDHVGDHRPLPGTALAETSAEERGAMLDRIIRNVRWLIENGLLRHTKRPPLLRIHPAEPESPVPPPK